ncbi:MAG: exo-alpha-sialidase [bacterium]
MNKKTSNKTIKSINQIGSETIGRVILMGLLFFFCSLSFAFAQWEPDIRLTFDASNSETSWNDEWCVAAHGDRVHVVWFDDRDGNDEIYYKRSTDAGSTWGTDTRLTNAPDNSWYPSIAVSGSNIHVVWFDYRDGDFEIYYKRSIDGGTTWETDIRLTNMPGFSNYPTIAVTDSNLHIVWHDGRDGNSEIYYKRSIDNGTTWETDIRLTENGAFSWNPTVAVSGLDVHVLWYDKRDGNYEVYYKRSTDAGSTWGTDTRLTNDSFVSEWPSVGVSGSNLHVVWDDSRDGVTYQIYYKRSTDAGTTWETDTKITNSSQLADHPSVNVSDSNIHVVWNDWRDINAEIYYKRSTDSGITWETDTRLTNNPATSQCASVAVADSSVHVVWFDTRDGNREIYYKRNPTGNPGPGIEEHLSGVVTGTKGSLRVLPNPFSKSTNISFGKEQSAEGIELKIYDVTAHLVKDFSRLTHDALRSTHITWDGTNDVGQKLPAGVYFVQLAINSVGKNGNYKNIQKVILLK